MTDDTRKKCVKWFWIIVSVPVLMVLIMLLLVWAFADIPSFEELENPESKLATEVIADDGQVLTTFHIENRSYVSYEELSPYLVQAAVATEDIRFYKHSGIDFQSLGRVLVKTLLMGDSGQGGGSTITQQLAKTLYPRADVSSSIPGFSKVKMVWIKLKEWITAVKLERDYTKDEILDMYLNAVFFGSSAYGDTTRLLIRTRPCTAGTSSSARWKRQAIFLKSSATPSSRCRYHCHIRSRTTMPVWLRTSGTCSVA